MELIGEDKMISAFPWSKYFIEAQGLKVEDLVMYQDNLRAMLLENIGRLSSGNQTKHTYIR